MVVVVDVVVLVGLGGFEVFVGFVDVVVVSVVVVVVAVVVVVVGRDDRDGRVVLECVPGTGTTGAVVVAVVGAGACWPRKSVLAGGGILISAMPSTTPAIADTTSAVLALIARSNGVLAARFTVRPPESWFTWTYVPDRAAVQPLA